MSQIRAYLTKAAASEGTRSVPPAPHAEQPWPVVPVWEAVAAPPTEDILAVVPVARPGFRSQCWHTLGSIIGWLFGVVVLIVGLAVLAVIPIAQFLSLGYLLEVGGRLARTGRWRDAFIGVRPAARIGGLVLGTALILSPLYVISALATAAELIDPGGRAARGWGAALSILTVLAVIHIVGAWSRGGRLHHFLWPAGNPLTLWRRFWTGEALEVLGLICLGNFWWLGRRLLRGGYYPAARDAVWDFVVSLRLPYYFWLGVRGFVVAFVWLAVPISLLAVGRQAPLWGILGTCLFTWVLLYVPFLQMRLAREQRFGAGFQLKAVRADFRKAPVAFLVAFFFTLLLAVPLFLLKIEMVPREAAWTMSIFFILSIWPARLLTGWALARAARRAAPRHGFFRWACRLLMFPIAAAYVLIAYFSQFTSWYGIWSLYEQHAFLLPVPFLEF